MEIKLDEIKLKSGKEDMVEFNLTFNAIIPKKDLVKFVLPSPGMVIDTDLDGALSTVLKDGKANLQMHRASNNGLVANLAKHLINFIK